MSIEHTTIAGEPGAAAADEQQAWHDRYAGAAVVGIVLLLVALTSVLTVRWFGGLDLVTPVGNAAAADMPTPGGTAFGTGISANGSWDSGFAPDRQPIDIRSVTPVITENSADASVALLRCTGVGPAVASGVAGIDLTTICPGATPFVPGTMVLGELPHEDFLVVVSARVPGVVRIDGFRVDYAVGVRSTTVDAGINIRVTVGGPGAGTASDDAVPPS